MNDEGKRADAPLVYAVWIRGRGWLKQNDAEPQTTFADVNREVAESAAQLWGKDARVLPFDGALLDLEQKFLAREIELSFAFRLRIWLARFL